VLFLAGGALVFAYSLAAAASVNAATRRPVAAGRQTK
jgi:hypothetical protein